MLAALTLIACEHKPESAEEWISRGDDRVFAREYSEASRAYEKALIELSARPRDERGALERTTLDKLAELRHHYLGDVPGAMRAYRALAETAPESEAAYHARVACARLLRDKLADRDSALSELEGVVETFASRPDIAKIHLELAQLAFSMGKYAVAETHSERAIEDRALRTEAELLLASTFEIRGSTKEAVRVYREMLLDDLAPDVRSRVNYEIGRGCEALGDLSAAADHYRAARLGASSPGLIDARLSRIRTRLAMGRSSSIRP